MLLRYIGLFVVVWVGVCLLCSFVVVLWCLMHFVYCNFGRFWFVLVGIAGVCWFVYVG